MNKKYLASKILLITSLCLIVLITIFFIVMFIVAKKDDIDNNNQLASGISAVIFIIYGGIGYGVLTIINIIAYILFRCSKMNIQFKKLNKIQIAYILIPVLIYGIILGVLLIYL